LRAVAAEPEEELVAIARARLTAVRDAGADAGSLVDGAVVDDLAIGRVKRRAMRMEGLS
jgi:hypothetical protein